MSRERFLLYSNPLRGRLIPSGGPFAPDPGPFDPLNLTMAPDRSAFAKKGQKGPAMQLHAPDLLARMTTAAAVAEGADWAQVQAYVLAELRRLAYFFALLERRRWEEHWDEDEARLWATIAVNHAQSALTGLETYGLPGAPKVVGAAVAAVRGQVNRAVAYEVM